MMAEKNHEIVDAFRLNLHQLSSKLIEMLNEHYTHQTERRGCGYTQATRVIAEYVNKKRDSDSFDDLKLFDGYTTKSLSNIMQLAQQHDISIENWRNLELQPEMVALLNDDSEQNNFKIELQQQFNFQQKLRQIQHKVSLEESKIFCQLIEDIILPKDAKHIALTELNGLTDKPKVGSCPMAEKFFLKVAYHQVLRQGIINIFVNEQQQPIMMEKLKMGDDHSCISLVPLILNGVRLPAGSLFSTDYELDDYLNKPLNKHYKGHIIPINEAKFWFLRLTTLAISPENRARTFTTHFQQQIQNDLLNPDITQLSQITAVALEQLG